MKHNLAVQDLTFRITYIATFITALFFSFSAVAQVSETAVVSAAATASVSTSATEATVPQVVSEKPAEFVPSNKLSGDFRYRQQETTDNQKAKRRVHRIMFRIGQTFFIQPDLKFTYRLMTGSSTNSGNTTIAEKDKTQGSPRYGIGLDQAFITYNPETDLVFFLGKMPQYFHTAAKNQIILDRDITPEGLALQYKYNFIEKKLDGTLNLASLWVREKYDDSFGEDQSDSFLNVGQIILSQKFNSSLSANYGLGIFSFTGIKDSKPGDYTVPASTDFKGNTADLLLNYANNYEMDQKFLELKWSQKPYEVSVFAESLQNSAADTSNKASMYGVGLGYDKFSLSYMKQTIEADAVLAVYTNSDFANGQTDSRGSIISAGYKFNKNAAINYTIYDAERTVSTLPTKYKLSHLDLTVSF